MAAAFCGHGIFGVVDREEDVGGAAEIGEGGADGDWVGRLHEHEGHRGAEEDDVGGGILGKRFALKVFLPEGYGLHGFSSNSL